MATSKQQDNERELTVNDMQDHISDLLQVWWEQKGQTSEVTKEVLYGIELGLMDQGLSVNINVHEDSNTYEDE